MNKLKENWLKEDEHCATCGATTRRVRGLTKQNLTRLIKPTWSTNELTITFLLIFFIIIALLYKAETKDAREWISNMTRSATKEECKFGCAMQCSKICSQMYELNLSTEGLNLTLSTLNYSNFTIR